MHSREAFLAPLADESHSPKPLLAKQRNIVRVCFKMACEVEGLTGDSFYVRPEEPEYKAPRIAKLEETKPTAIQTVDCFYLPAGNDYWTNAIMKLKQHKLELPQK